MVLKVLKIQQHIVCSNCSQGFIDCHGFLYNWNFKRQIFLLMFSSVLKDFVHCAPCLWSCSMYHINKCIFHIVTSFNLMGVGKKWSFFISRYYQITWSDWGKPQRSSVSVVCHGEDSNWPSFLCKSELLPLTWLDIGGCISFFLYAYTFPSITNRTVAVLHKYFISLVTIEEAEEGFVQSVFYCETSLMLYD